MKITIIPISQLAPASVNVRMHPQKQINELKRSVKMFGQTRAIVVDEQYSIIAGNGLYTALKDLGYDTAECYVMEGLTENQKKKLMLADNRVYELGMMDMDVFEKMINEMSGDSDIPGWDEELIKTLTYTPIEADDMIGDYGVFAKDEIDYLNKKKRDDFASEPQTAQYAPVGSGAYYEPTQANKRQEEPFTGHTAQADTAQVQRYVVCPKCGEKIWL